MARAWHLIAPVGEFPHPAGVTQVIDRAAVEAMAGAFDPARKVLVDFDHYSDLTNAQREKIREAGVQLPSEAAGWITAVRATDAGLEGQIETTPAGAKALENAAYRFLSPVWRRKDCEAAGEGRVRPLALAKVGLTNEPNIKAIPEMVANRGQERLIGPTVDFMANRVGGEDDQENAMDKTKLCNALGLDPEKATDDEAVAAIETLKKKGAAAEALKNRAEAAEAKIVDAEKAALKARVDAALKEHEGVIVNRAEMEEALTKDFDGTLKVIKGLKLQTPPTLPKRADGYLPPGDDKDFDAKVRAQREAVESYCNRNPGTNRTTAYDILRAQGHEAFK
jgi:phage I-like protein